jgi:tetratricopeptide (TPR) repeat protein
MTHLRIVSLILIASARAPSTALCADKKVDAAYLRTLFFQRDFETAVIEATRAGAAATRQSELKAWFVLNLVRSGEDAKAITIAEEMTRTRPDGWSWFALAGALNYARERPDEAIAAAEYAAKLLPRNPDVLWIRAQTLANDPKRRDEAIAFVERERGRLKNPAELLVSKGYALYSQSAGTPRDDAKFAAALATFEEARKVDPANLSAWYLPASYLTSMRRSDEAYLLLKTALGLAPRSTAVHQAFWSAVNGSRELGAERKRQEIEADVTLFLGANGNRPGALRAVSSISQEMKWTDRQVACEEAVLTKFHDSLEAEWILSSRWRELGQTKEGTESPEYRKILTEFVARPQHHVDGLLGEACRNLFEVIASDPGVSGDELYRVAEGALKYETINPHIVWVSTPIRLADRKVHLADAERIARDGIDVLRKKVESQRSLYRSQGEYERSLSAMTGRGHDALGWVLFAQGRFDEAEKELLAAYELNHEDRRTLEHLGRFYLSSGDQAKAEDYFVQGLGVQALGVNPCETALREVYEKRRGSLTGFDDYVATLRDSDRRKRRTDILASRSAAPEAVPAFALKDVSGKQVTLASLKGRIVVINYWGIWCGWCIQELPAYQKLYEKYANDPQVAILTIDNDANPDDVPPWMAQKKFTFPVLIDDQYVRKVGVTSFPTTWFLDQDGRKMFEKVGWSQELLEEFTWRIEALRK